MSHDLDLRELNDGPWRRNRGGIVLYRDAGDNFELGGQAGKAPVPKPPAIASSLTASQVKHARIDGPAQAALVRLSRLPVSSLAANTLLDHVKAGRLAGIVCINSTPGNERAAALGSSSWLAIPTGEDAVVMLDPADLRGGAPLIAYKRGLDPACPEPGAPKNSPAQFARLDAALLKAFASFELWRAGIQLGKSAGCALTPLDDAARALKGKVPANMRVLNNVLPRLLCLPSVIPTTPGTPVLLRHRHIRRTCDSAFLFTNDPTTPLDLLASNMNPRFLLPNDTYSTHPPLDLKLAQLLRDKHRHLITAESAKTLKPQPGDRVRVALVDLTGRKICQPQFAGFGESETISGASTPKILLVYAAHQLLFDLREIVRLNRISTRGGLDVVVAREWVNIKCKPDLDWLFKFTDNGDADRLKIEMRGDPETVGVIGCKKKAAEKGWAPIAARPGHLVGHLRDMVSECNSTTRANELILRIGFEYLASLAWQSGLWHPQRGGLWFGSTYCTSGTKAPVKPACHTVVTGCSKVSPKRITWNQSPAPKGVFANAASVATFFTLMAQGRLVNKPMTADIEKVLDLSCTFIGAAGTTARARAQKCGLVPGQLKHDGALVDDGTHRWAVAILTETKGGAPITNQIFFNLVNDLHKLIKANN